ncbi:M24 family metallopeptidase [Actinoalloteichus hymeniacidonis]|uniref:Xaa-Pro aminopeptidase n=1 Tax=Actinoalloteichus hymeniacidonis TaxID=340345 RepID=A0AAC9MYU5_9PSEU|nr:Xaa-Pro peptidase family protein [Actinoalloteichus hymeniacidonis]AOS63241.1 Xaa-Pro aminopeptidase [Actinoalloteichus hymeniacidonis]MBB5908720.1 Xaa-Pro aminopeptidase [Actinoalloteichus hymeniacidonis]
MSSTPVSLPTAQVLRDRIDRARAACAAGGLDALLVAPGSDLRYLLGVSGGSHERLTTLVVPAEGIDAQPILVLPKLEAPGFAAVPAEEIGLGLATWVDGENPYQLVRDLLGAGGRLPRRVAVGDMLEAMHVLALRTIDPSIEQSLTGPVLRELRMRKTAEEIEGLASAGAAIDRVHARMGEWLRVGRTEAEIGADIAAAIVEEGHTGAEFVIVGSGPNGASPHHDVSDRIVQAGDVVVIDIGGPIPSGYNSDCTRTYVLGEPADDVRATYEVLRSAQQAAVDAVRPGVTAAEIDAAAREPIEAAGLGEFFIHRTGHGIGLDVHEEPYIVGGNDLPVEEGMAFSVEPGIYLPGRWGARIEDIVVVTADGVRSVNTRTHELTVLPA